MGYPTSDNQGIDWSQMLREGDYGKAQAVAKREAANALAWKKHAEELEKKLLEARQGWAESLLQRDGWRNTARQLWDNFCKGKTREELTQVYRKNKEAVRGV